MGVAENRLTVRCVIFSTHSGSVSLSEEGITRIMSPIVAAVFEATIGLLVNKGRDLAADQQFRSLIVREIDEIKSKLDGLARTNLLASISFFKEGLVYLYKVLDLKTSEEDGKVTVQGDARIERENFEVGLRSTSAAGLLVA